LSEPDYVAVNRENWTRANADYTDARAHEAWSQLEITWGTTRVPESEIDVLPEVAGKDVVELGCGTAYFGAWLARRGARVVGVDVTPAQLETARRMEAEFGLGLEFVEANAEATGLPSESFDLVFSEYGASIWCDPAKWIPEAARLLRPGGRLVFLRNSTLAILCSTFDGGPVETLQRPQRGLYRVDWTEPDEVEFHQGHGDWVRLLRANGFEIEELVELFAADDAVDHEYYHSNAEWAKRWPSEEIWRARLLVPLAGIGSRRAEPGSADA
jgi:SAM-dependent methyltransferase